MMQLNSLLRKHPHSARRVPITADGLIDGHSGSPSLEVVECAIFYVGRAGGNVDEIAKLEGLKETQAATARAWAGFEPLQIVSYQTGPTAALGGDFRILYVRTQSDAPPYAVGVALTDLYDWSDNGRKIAAAGDTCEILVAHLAAKTEKRHAL